MNLRLKSVPRPAWARFRASPRLATTRTGATARTKSGGGDHQQLSKVSLGNVAKPVPRVQSPFPRLGEPVSALPHLPGPSPHAAPLRRHRRSRLRPAAWPTVRGLRGVRAAWRGCRGRRHAAVPVEAALRRGLPGHERQAAAHRHRGQQEVEGLEGIRRPSAAAPRARRACLRLGHARRAGRMGRGRHAPGRARRRTRRAARG